MVLGRSKIVSFVKINGIICYNGLQSNHPFEFARFMIDDASRNVFLRCTPWTFIGLGFA